MIIDIYMLWNNSFPIAFQPFFQECLFELIIRQV